MRASFPFRRALPFVLAALAVVLIVSGILGDDTGSVVIGAVGLAAAALSLLSRRLAARTRPPGDDPPA
jgi:hypothetical protein